MHKHSAMLHGALATKNMSSAEVEKLKTEVTRALAVCWAGEPRGSAFFRPLVVELGLPPVRSLLENQLRIATRRQTEVPARVTAALWPWKKACPLCRPVSTEKLGHDLSTSQEYHRTPFVVC